MTSAVVEGFSVTEIATFTRKGELVSPNFLNFRA